MQTKSFTIERKSDSAGHLKGGQFVGYAAVFNNLDSHGDITKPGAFSKTLADWESSGAPIPVLWEHDTKDPFSNIGHVVEASEDNHGLKVLVQLDTGTPKADQVHRLLKSGRVSQMSFAYEVQQGQATAQGYELHQMKLHEVSVVPVGANQETTIVSVKSERPNTKKAAIMKTSVELKSEYETMVKAAKGGTATSEQVGRFETITQDIEAAEKREAPMVKALAAHAAAQKHEKAIADGEALVKAMGEAPEADGWPGMSDGSDWNLHMGKKGHSAFSLGTGKGSAPFTLSKNMFGSAATAIATQAKGAGAGFGFKSILPAGSYDGPLNDGVIVPLGRDTQSILELLPTVLIEGRHFSYMRQAERANKAAVVAPGDTKPTSTMGLEMVKAETKVIAHLSEPLDVFLLEDIGNLQSLVKNEMQFGLSEALDRQLLNGTGDTQLTGLLNTEGIQTQEFVADALTSIRTAITKARQAGYKPKSIVIGYADWQAIELLKDGEGRALLNASSPVDVAQKRLWGLQVVESANATAGTALVMCDGAAGIVVSKPGIRLEWHVSGEGFETNTIRVRCEARAELVITQPAAIVKVAITGE